MENKGAQGMDTEMLELFRGIYEIVTITMSIALCNFDQVAISGLGIVKKEKERS